MPMLFLAVAIAIVDQAVKYYVENHMVLGMSIPVVPGVFHLTYIRNQGAAFGIMHNQTVMLIVLAIALIAAAVWFYQSLPASRYIHVSLGLLVGGAAGNLIDRVVLGYVVDFFDMRIWPVFNIADIAIVSGVAGLIFMLWHEGKEGNKLG